MTPHTLLDPLTDPLVPALPTRSEVRAAIPPECFERSLRRSLAALAMSLLAVAVPTAVAAMFVPMTWAWAPLWLLHAVLVGTAATGLWVVAHECGHGAFSPDRRLQDAIGFVLHSALLVPYFSWQRSHAVHHRATNQLDLGETHVPKRAESAAGASALRLRRRVGPDAFAVMTILRTLLLGWPAYLLAGVSGSPRRGRTNHFWPVAPFRSELFPKRLHSRVRLSALGVVTAIGALVAWGIAAGSIAPVLTLYVGPYLVTNAWLVGYTWLQHSSSEVPHYEDPEWSWLLGAFQTVDRPYGAVVDRLHHRIGTTHVVHHIDHRIPHYHARRATEALRTAFPQWCRYDPTPVAVALWRVARDCVAVERRGDGWYYTDRSDPIG
jgi:fatty acid desaturase